MSFTASGETATYGWSNQPLGRTSLFQWTHGLINRVVSLSDVVTLLALGLLSPTLAGHDGGVVTLAQSFFITALTAVVFVFVLQAMAAYRSENYAKPSLSISQAMIGLVCGWAASAGYVLALGLQLTDSWTWFLAYHVPQFAGLVVLRFGAWILVRQIDKRALLRRHTIVIGCGDEAEAVVRRLTDPQRATGFNVIGVVGANDGVAPGLFAGRPLLGDLSAMMALGRNSSVDLVVIALPFGERGAMPRIIEALQWVSADIVLSLDATTAESMNRPMADIAGLPVLPLSQKPLKGSQALFKLVEDWVFAAAALLIAAPAMLLVALAIRLDSPGPVMFRQDRVGLHNRIFRIYKFRTMTVDDSDDGTVGTNSRHNPRITRVGGVLRKLSLDELPQLLNVLRGEMSIVGPRPYVRNMLVEDLTFDTAVRLFAARHRIKPGITGLAQASGFRSNALRSKANAELSIKLDLDYIANWSLWLDLRIMVRTVTMAMAGSDVF